MPFGKDEDKYSVDPRIEPGGHIMSLGMTETIDRDRRPCVPEGELSVLMMRYKFPIYHVNLQKPKR